MGNPWLDAGIGALQLPCTIAKDQDYWRRWFPADFITESFPGQFRNWFYSMLAMSTALAGEAPFKTVLGYATLFAEDGREMHKSWGNAIEFNEAAEHMGADVMRWMFLAHKPESNINFGYGPGGEARRRFLIPLWNVYAFLVQYANVSDGWTAPAFAAGDVDTWLERLDLPELDRWILLRLNGLVADMAQDAGEIEGHAVRVGLRVARPS